MYNQNKMERTSLRVNASVSGETIEAKMRRVFKTGEAIQDGAPLIYTEMKDGVVPEYNCRTDRFDLALDEAELVSKNNIAKRDELLKTPDDLGVGKGEHMTDATQG